MAIAGDHVIVKMDDSGGTPRQFANGDITSVDLGQTFDQHDVTGFGDAVHRVINGQLQAPVTLKGFLTTTANTALTISSGTSLNLTGERLISPYSASSLPSRL